MDASESSVIARKLRTYYLTQHSPRRKAPEKLPKRELTMTNTSSTEPGYVKNLMLVALMGVAVFFTEISLRLIKWAKRLEQN